MSSRPDIPAVPAPPARGARRGRPGRRRRHRTHRPAAPPRPAVTRAGTRVLLDGTTQHLDSQRAERELGVTFRPLQATITDQTAWYRSHGALPAPRDHAPSTERTKAGTA